LWVTDYRETAVAGDGDGLADPYTPPPIEAGFRANDESLVLVEPEVKAAS
jgi:hypothetical protein